MKLALNGRLRAFTRLELLISASLALLILAVIFADTQRTRKGSLQTRCLKNLRLLQSALTQYVQDHDGELPEDEGAQLDGEWRTLRGWVSGNAKSDGTLDSLIQGELYSYVGRPGIYRCPADKSLRVGSDQLRFRSYALNFYVGTHYPARINGPRKLSEISAPDRTFSFIDEEAESINDGAFAVHPREKPLWWDIPADRHDQGGTLSFVDGHAEYWKWRAPKPGFSNNGKPASADDAADLFRVQEAALPP